MLNVTSTLKYFNFKVCRNFIRVLKYVSCIFLILSGKQASLSEIFQSCFKRIKLFQSNRKTSLNERGNLISRRIFRTS